MAKDPNYEAGRRDGKAAEQGKGSYDAKKFADATYRKGLADGRSEHVDEQLRKGK
jgi:hypothetical protein